MSEIVLATLNARHAHASLGLRSLLANLGELRASAELREFTLKDAPLQVCEELLSTGCRVLGLGVYIWNVAQTTELVRLLKALRPELLVVLGGPEVSHEPHAQDIVAAADFVVCGEGEVSFPRLCRALLRGERPPQKVIAGVLPDVGQLKLPYDEYSAADVQSRVVYVEASRGCPFKCEFCLSSLDKAVRDVPLDRFLGAMEQLLLRGVERFKFIDRTFNLRTETCRAILEFFLSRLRPGLFLHFELIPDRLPPVVRELAARFPPGALQFEVGIQTFDPAVCARISRRQDNAKVEENLRFLLAHTGVHVHADLIVGLPGETLESFARGFDRLVALSPQEIQVGLLKRLRGTPIVRHDASWGMVYSPAPPYEILQTADLDFTTVQQLRRFAKYWDLVHNSGNFGQSIGVLLSLHASPFTAFFAFSDWLFARMRRLHSISLEELSSAVLDHLLEAGVAEEKAGPMLLADYLRPAQRRVPPRLKPYADAVLKPARADSPSLPGRQARHLAKGAVSTRVASSRDGPSRR